MAVIAHSSDPGDLVSAIREAIDDGSVDTWEYDEDGDFTHSPFEWRRKGWMRPTLRSDRVIFTILPPRGAHLSREVYGVYHGRFIEMLLAHFDDRFSRVIATALPDFGDQVADWPARSAQQMASASV